MKISEVETAITTDSKYITHVKDVTWKTNVIAIITFEYWLRIGSTTECVNYVKRYIAINYELENETAYEDKTTIVQTVRAKKW